MKTLLYLLLIPAAVWATGCQPAGQSSDTTTDTRRIDSTGAEAMTGDAEQLQGEYRYLTVFKSEGDGPANADSMQLNLNLKGNTATGTYQWVLPGKDGKRGTITGVLSGHTVSGQYHYQQEGGSYSDSIRIQLEGDRAMVTQFSGDGYQLKDTLTAASTSSF
ncbi:hypothetical protein [Compostibacter hankyongensis]